MDLTKKIEEYRGSDLPHLNEIKESYENISLTDAIWQAAEGLNPNGKIVSHKRTGVTAKNQRQLTSAIKHARFLGLLPFVVK